MIKWIFLVLMALNIAELIVAMFFLQTFVFWPCIIMAVVCAIMGNRANEREIKEMEDGYKLEK